MTESHVNSVLSSIVSVPLLQQFLVHSSCDVNCAQILQFLFIVACALKMECVSGYSTERFPNNIRCCEALPKVTLP